MPQQLLTYEQVADLIEQALGERPAPSTLRAAAAMARRTGPTGRARTSITAGLPAPIAAPPGEPARFHTDDIRHWLDRHPRRLVHAAQERITAATDDGERERAVQEARTAGVSWSAIAEALAAATGGTYSKQAAQKRYGER